MTLEKLRELTNEQLNERFPFMVTRNAFDGHICKDDETGEVLNQFFDWGWRDIQLALAEHIKPIYDRWSAEAKEQFTLFDIKEKWGKLRTSWSGSNDAIDNWTSLAEHISSYTCIQCGDREKYKSKYYYWQSKGWICPYCDTCAKKLYDDRAKDSDEEVGEYEWKSDYDYETTSGDCTYERWGDGPKLKITMKAEEFWKLGDDE